MTALAACMAVSVLHGALSDRYNEAPVVSLVQQGSVIEIWAAPDTKTWTVVQVKPDGQACILATGTGIVAAAPPPEGDPA